jgi:hypothetical protein
MYTTSMPPRPMRHVIECRLPVITERAPRICSSDHMDFGVHVYLLEIYGTPTTTPFSARARRPTPGSGVATVVEGVRRTLQRCLFNRPNARIYTKRHARAMIV